MRGLGVVAGFWEVGVNDGEVGRLEEGLEVEDSCLAQGMRLGGLGGWGVGS